MVTLILHVTRSRKRTKDVVTRRILVRPMRLAARWGSLSAPPDPLATIGGRGPTSKGKKKKGRGKGRGLPPLFNCDYGPIAGETRQIFVRELCWITTVKQERNFLHISVANVAFASLQSCIAKNTSSVPQINADLCGAVI